MADTPHTRFTELKEAILALKDLSSAHSDQIASINDALSSIATSMTMLDGNLDQLRLSPTPPPRDLPLAPRSLKLDFPRFDGTDAAGWLFKVSRFFCNYSIPDEQRLFIASFHVDGPALASYQWMHNNQQFSSWSAFSATLLTRFGPTAYDDPQGALAKLTQTFVESYQEQFQVLANHTSGLSASFTTSCFIAKLKPNIRRDVISLRPVSLSDAIGLARLQPDKYSSPRQPPGPSVHRPAPLLPMPPSKPSSAPPFKVLTLAEQ